MGGELLVPVAVRLAGPWLPNPDQEQRPESAFTVLIALDYRQDYVQVRRDERLGSLNCPNDDARMAFVACHTAFIRTEAPAQHARNLFSAGFVARTNQNLEPQNKPQRQRRGRLGTRRLPALNLARGQNFRRRCQ